MIRTKHLVVVAAALSFAVIARADFINGTAWSVPAATADNTPVLGSTPGSGATELATFTANGINFSGDAPGAYNIGGFLNSGGTASNITFMNGATATTNLDNTEWVFTGSAFFTHDQTFTVEHDDGVNMYVNGSAVLLDGGPTAPTNTPFTYTGTTGTFSFEFIYTECCGGTADFKTTLVPDAPSTGTPEPSTGFLAIGGAGILFLARRRFARS